VNVRDVKDPLQFFADLSNQAPPERA